LVDLGAGSCETARWLLRRCAHRDLRLRVTACDHDHRVVDYARRHCGGLAGLTVRQSDALDIRGLEPVDYVFGNHILHHLSDRRIIALLKTVSRLEPRAVVLNDIERTRAAYLAFYIGVSPFAGHGYIYRDGLLSIRKGFRRRELERLLGACGPDGARYRIESLFPGRIVLRR
jgi:2-polyprenyl-3-methyl-5-hydroxy-6-metoxy-1,4-benzoquinol methylase